MKAIITLLFISSILLPSNIFANTQGKPLPEYYDNFLRERFKIYEYPEIFLEYFNKTNKYNRKGLYNNKETNIKEKGGATSKNYPLNKDIFNYISIKKFLKEVDSFIYLERFA